MNDLQSTIEKAKKGDQSSFYALYTETYPRNRYIALKYVKQDFDANDVLQDAYIRIFNNLDKFSYAGEGSFQSWTSKIVSNTALNHLRKKNPVLFSETEDEEGNSTIQFIEDERPEAQPELSYEKSEVAGIVSELLNELSEEQRVVVMMYYFQEYSVKEIAAECACNENTVKSRLNYARKKLETKATDLKKRGILTTAFTLSAMFILLRDDFAMAAVGSGFSRALGAVWQGICTEGASSMAGVGGTAISASTHVGRVVLFKKIALVGGSAVFGAGLLAGGLFLGGVFSNGQGESDDPGNSVPAVTSTATPTPVPEMADTPTPPADRASASPDVTPEPTPEETEEPKKTKKPKRTHRPRRTPRPARTPAPERTRAPEREPESTEWDNSDDSMEWDDDFTEWDD